VRKCSRLGRTHRRRCSEKCIEAAYRAATASKAETGSLYPALHRLEKQGVGQIKDEWRQSENRRRAKYYSLTPSGKKQVGTEHARWKQMSAAIAGLMEPA
jgi:PadR family transcriptional regulator, regulatory protein PadR